jgi:DNA-directed RNA polymerase specialized sigma24 family protein
VLRAIYQNFAGQISNYILQKNGSPEDAKDVFQDAIMIILEKVQSRSLPLKRFILLVL